ncbi:MAG: class I SAM-dependent methyltransferase [Jejuia sp.]
MNKLILNTEIQEFINSNTNSDINKILLKGTAFEEVSTTEIIQQIEAKKRCQKKLPSWFRTKKIYYPNKLNIEQTSSEITAKHKSELISGNTIVDLTGGFGVDCFYFSKRFKKIVHCEINSELSAIVKHNYNELNITNIETVNTNGLEFLEHSKEIFDWIYIDPSRRHDKKGKVFFLKDCLPNVPANLEVLFQYSKNILIKTSPLLDITAGMNELNHVKEIHVVAVNNEVKELLWVLESDFKSSTSIKTVNIKKDTNEFFDFNILDTQKTSNYSQPLTYLYEPNAAILKSGGFHEITNQFEVSKLHEHSHLYTSASLVENFAGRTFKIEKTLPYNKKNIKSLGINKANITTRNFPENVEQLRKKLKIRDGGNIYLFYTTNLVDEKIVIICSKI